MLVLAADTATEYCNLAIFENDTLLSKVSFKNRGTHSKNIIENIDYCFSLAGREISETDLFAAGTGPGNFTGVRIGVSTLKGLAYTLNKPLVGISALDSAAYRLRFSERKILSVIDARRKEVYFSYYQFNGGVLVEKSPESVVKPENIKSGINDEEVVITGNAALMYKDVFDLLFENVYYPPAWMTEISPEVIFELGVEKYKNNNIDETFGIVPNYIRKSNAEENLKKG